MPAIVIATVAVGAWEDATTEADDNQSDTNASYNATHIYILYLIKHIQYK